MSANPSPTDQDLASAQLQRELLAAAQEPYLSLRPILWHVNADTTWCLQLPRPTPPKRRRPDERHFYNILVDPWLAGPQSDVAAWFSTQWHAIESSVPSIAELDQRLCETEMSAQEALHPHHISSSSIRTSSAPFIDLVLLSHEFTDHTHQPTLLEVPASVPVIATEKAADLVRSWGHFTTVLTAPTFSAARSDFRTPSLAPAVLPPWLGVSRLVSADNKLYYHSALMVAFNLSPPHASAAAATNPNPNTPNKEWEAIIYTPHGIHPSTLAPLTPHLSFSHSPALQDPFIDDPLPPLRITALLHGLHAIYLPVILGQLNLGAHNGLAVQRACRAKYWVGTHDEVKKGGGLVSRMLQRTVLRVEDAVRGGVSPRAVVGKGERREESEGDFIERDWSGVEDGEMDAPTGEEMQGVNFVELASGETLVLL
jgi:hypothetical protein